MFVNEFGGAKKDYFVRNIFVKHDENFSNNSQKIIDEFKHRDIYHSIFSYADETNINECEIYGPFYLDFDCPDNIEKALFDTKLAVSYLNNICKIPAEFIEVYYSGNKGFHVLVSAEIFGLEPNKELNLMYKIFANEILNNTLYKTLDTKIYDRKRLFRIAGTINSKTNLYKVPIPHKMLYQLTVDKIFEWAQTPKKVEYAKPRLIEQAAEKFINVFQTYLKQKTTITKNGQKIEYDIPERDLLPCTKSILENGVKEGMRNNTAVVLASSLLQAGKKLNEVIELMLQWNTYNEPPLPEKEIYATAKSAHHMLLNGKTFGCTGIKNLELCCENCAISNRRESK